MSRDYTFNSNEFRVSDAFFQSKSPSFWVIQDAHDPTDNQWAHNQFAAVTIPAGRTGVLYVFVPASTTRCQISSIRSLAGSAPRRATPAPSSAQFGRRLSPRGKYEVTMSTGPTLYTMLPVKGTASSIALSSCEHHTVITPARC
jgi:hypothetical protein